MTRSTCHTALACAGLLVLSACASAPQVAVAPETPRGDLVLRASGSGDWRVACTVETARGRTAEARIEGRVDRDTDVIVVNDAIGGACTYDAGDGPLTLTAEGGDMACPFAVASGELCRAGVPAQASGAFEIRPQ